MFRAMSPKIEHLKAIQFFKVGEGPHWDPHKKVLYISDVPNGTITCWSPETNNAVYYNLGVHSSFVIPIKGKPDEYLASCGLELLHIKWDTKNNNIMKKDVLVKVDEAEKNKINDAKCDVNGRIWFGTFGETVGASRTFGNFYSFTRKEGLRKHESEILVSNGIGFSTDNKKMYYIDSLKHRVDQYSVDVDNGTREFEKTVINFKEADLEGVPDGMTVDAEGKLWVACIFAGQIIRVDQDSGKVIDSVKIPEALQTTSVTFGGPDFEELYVTSAKVGDFPGYEHTANTELAGGTFKVTGLGVKGLPPFEFNWDI